MGLLDGLMGDSWDDPRTQAMLALSAGLLSNNGSKGLSAGLLGAGQAFQGARDADVARKLKQAQIDNYMSEVESRKEAIKRAQADQEWGMRLFQGGGQPQGAPSVPQGGMPAPQGGASIGGAPAMPQGVSPGFLASLNEDQIVGLVKLGRLPESAIKMWEFAKFGKERQPGTYTEKADGSRVFNPNPKDLINYDPNTQTVSPLRGAIESNAAIKGAETTATERAKSQFDLVDVYDPETGSMVKRPRAQVLGAANGGARIGEVANPWVGDPAQARAAIMAMRDPQARAEALRQFTEAQGAGPMQSGPSTAEKIAAEAATKKAVDLAGGEATRQNERTEKGNTASTALGMIQRARDILQVGSPTASGFGSLVDSGLGVVGVSTKGAEAAAKLDSIAGWLTSNVPRMQGPQSDRDVAQYKIMAGMVGDRTKPVAQRLAALEEVQAIQTKYAQNSERQIAPQEGRSWVNASPAPSIPPAAAAALRMFKNDPQKRAEFDAKFGPGAAASILGQ